MPATGTRPLRADAQRNRDRLLQAAVRAFARAVSMPMPDAPPVTITRWPVRSIPCTTSAAVDWAVNGVVMSGFAVMVLPVWLGAPDREDGRYDMKPEVPPLVHDYKRSRLRLSN